MARPAAGTSWLAVDPEFELLAVHLAPSGPLGWRCSQLASKLAPLTTAGDAAAAEHNKRLRQRATERVQTRMTGMENVKQAGSVSQARLSTVSGNVQLRERAPSGVFKPCCDSQSKMRGTAPHPWMREATHMPDLLHLQFARCEVNAIDCGAGVAARRTHRVSAAAPTGHRY